LFSRHQRDGAARITAHAAKIRHRIANAEHVEPTHIRPKRRQPTRSGAPRRFSERRSVETLQSENIDAHDRQS
jgi:hypothetical protein